MTTVVDSMTVFAAKNTCVLTVKQSWENVCKKETYCKNQPNYLVCLLYVKLHTATAVKMRLYSLNTGGVKETLF